MAPGSGVSHLGQQETAMGGHQSKRLIIANSDFSLSSGTADAEAEALLGAAHRTWLCMSGIGWDI